MIFPSLIIVSCAFRVAFEAFREWRGRRRTLLFRVAGVVFVARRLHSVWQA